MARARHKRITLIELVIVTTMFGILTAIAFSLYQDSVRRTRIAELLQATTTCKTLVSEYFGAPAAEQIAYSVPRCHIAKSQLASASAVTNSGEIEVRSAVPGATGNIKLIPLGANGQPADVHNAPVTISGWRCGPGFVDPMVVRYLPGDCRAPAA